VSTPEGEEDEGYGLLMPFTVCASQGGPYDDAAFVAGYTAGLLDGRLADPDNGWPIAQQVPSALVPQLDLLAMRHGWNITSEPWGEHPDEWTLVTFTRWPR
jgi:hypothetical protein